MHSSLRHCCQKKYRAPCKVQGFVEDTNQIVRFSARPFLSDSEARTARNADSRIAHAEIWHTRASSQGVKSSLEAIATRVEAIALRLEAIAIRLSLASRGQEQLVICLDALFFTICSTRWKCS